VVITDRSLQPSGSIDGVATHCPYCALQCGLFLVGERDVASVHGNPQFPVNAGGLCIKGWSAAAALSHPDRLLAPLVRDRTGALVPTGWDTALDHVARRFRAVQARYGSDAVGVLGGGALTNEKAYLLGKFARVVLETRNIDSSSRFCMSSSALAMEQAFGLDRGLPFPLADLPHAKVIFLAGTNIADTMPPLMRYFEAQQVNGGTLIVADPRQSATARWAALHLKLRPGSDLALANGLLHVLIRDHLIDDGYIRTRTSGFDEVRRITATYWPERVEQLTGVPEAEIIEAAHQLGKAPTAMILTGRGPEQQARGVNNTLAYINLALALGAVGKPFSGYGSLTGQSNGQGAREHGQRADQLPGYRSITDPIARQHVAAVWGISEPAMPGPGASAFELLDSAGSADGVRALLVMGSNIAVSAPDAGRVEQRLKALECLVVADCFLSETAALADVVLPAAQWAEEDGTTTNLEGRVILRRHAFDPPGDARTDLAILSALAAHLGHPRRFAYATSREAFDELRRASHGGPADYSGISYERIEAEDGVFWPCAAPDHAGTPRLFARDFPTPTGRARFHAVLHQAPAEDRDDAYPLYLTTGRVLAHAGTGAQTRRIAELHALAPEAVAEMHPTAARLAHVSDGDRIQLTTRRGSAMFRLKVTRTIREDTVFVPIHWGGESSANRLTNPVLDPVSRMPEMKVCAVRVTPASEDPEA
jgi:assimilatory nitrate reductase catalytic subunit